MTRQWLKALAPDVTEGLLEELVAEASDEERVSILFNLLQNCLALAARGAETGQGILQRDGVIGAVTILSFLRDHLRQDIGNAANGVLRRFYKAAHRQIIKAHRDEAAIRFHEIRASVFKVIQKPYSSSFFYNCMQETAMNRAAMLDLLLSVEIRHCICRVDPFPWAFADEAESDLG